MDKLLKFLNTRKYSDFDDMVSFIDFLIDNKLIDVDIYDRINCIDLFNQITKG